MHLVIIIIHIIIYFYNISGVLNIFVSPFFFSFWVQAIFAAVYHSSQQKLNYLYCNYLYFSYYLPFIFKMLCFWHSRPRADLSDLLDWLDEYCRSFGNETKCLRPRRSSHKESERSEGRRARFHWLTTAMQACELSFIKCGDGLGSSAAFI